MLILFLTVALSIIFSIFATQNTDLVTLYFYEFSLPNIPLYMVILISVLTAFAASLVLHVLKNLSSSLTISSHKSKVRELKRELAEVTKELHKLEIENTKFKTELGEPEDSNSI